MNKKSIRAFSLGVIFAVSIIGVFHHNQVKEKSGINKKQAVEYLTKNNMAVISMKEYEDLKEMEAKATKAAKNNSTKKPQQTKSPSKDVPVTSYSLYVVKGMNSGEISRLLAEQKIIASKQDFEQYLIKNNYHTKIQLGTYNLNSKMTYQQIADALIK